MLFRNQKIPAAAAHRPFLRGFCRFPFDYARRILLMAALIAAAHAFVARAAVAVAIRTHLDAFQFAHLLVRLVVAAGTNRAVNRLILRHDLSLLHTGMIIACPARWRLCARKNHFFSDSMLLIGFMPAFPENTATARATRANRARRRVPRNRTTRRFPYSRKAPSCDNWTAAFHPPTRLDRRR